MSNLVDFIHLIYPNSCLGCDSVLVKGEKMVCTKCISNLPFTGFENGSSHHPTATKFYGKIPTTYIYCLLKYKKGNISQKLIYQYKYKLKKELCDLFAELQIKRWIEAGSDIHWDIMVPVPLHPKKLKKRGFNQSELYAEKLSKNLNIPLTSNALKRIESNKVQALLGRNSRFENVKSSYLINNKEVIQGKKVVLIDDVITTGATVEVCTNLLLKNGAHSVSIASIATSIYS